MSTMIEKLEDLLVQATKERSHYYVAGCCREAILHIKLIEGQRNLAANGLDRALKSLNDILSWCEDRKKMGMMEPELATFLRGIEHLAKDGIT